MTLDTLETSLAAIAALLGILGAQKAWRAYRTNAVLSRGLSADGEVLTSRVAMAHTAVEFQFFPEGSTSAVKARRFLEAHVNLVPGQKVAVRYLPSCPQVCVLADFAGQHDAS